MLCDVCFMLYGGRSVLYVVDSLVVCCIVICWWLFGGCVVLVVGCCLVFGAFVCYVCSLLVFVALCCVGGGCLLRWCFLIVVSCLLR